MEASFYIATVILEKMQQRTVLLQAQETMSWKRPIFQFVGYFLFADPQGNSTQKTACSRFNGKN
jgi:hypothetical protein